MTNGETRANEKALRLREIQLHADAVGIVEEELRIAGARYDALAEFHIAGLQALAHAVDVGRGKAIWSRRPVSSYFFSVPRTTMPSHALRVPIRCTVATPPE